MIVCVSYTASGAGMATFAFPVRGTIVGAGCSANQTSACVCSLNQATAPSSGVLGLDRSMICIFGNSARFADTLEFPVAANQNVSIDVKVAATFDFYVKV